MTSDANGNYTNAYTYGLDRISVDKLSPNSDAKTDPLFYLYDGRGSVANTTNSLGQVRDKYRYDPYGEVKHGGFWGSNGTHYENFYGYNGEDYNRLSGLEYLRARYYEPESGRFLTRDSYLGDVMQPLTLNRYAYALNNPMMYTDPSGHWPGWLDKAASSAKNFVSNAVDTVSNYVSKAVSYVQDVVSTGWGYVKKAYNYVADNVKSWYNSTKKTVDSYVTKAEQKISSAKENIKNTVNKIAKLAKPVITTRNYPNEVVRAEMDTIKKSCEGAQYLGTQDYKYKEQVLAGNRLDGANSVMLLSTGNAADDVSGVVKNENSILDFIIKVGTGVGAVVLGVGAIAAAAPVILPALAAGALEMGIVAIVTAVFGTTVTAMGASEISDGLFGVNPARDLASSFGISNEDYDLAFGIVAGGASIGTNILAPITKNPTSAIKGGVNTQIPKTREALHKNLLDKGYRCNGTSEGGYVTYMHPDGRRVDIRPNGEVINTLKEWLPDHSRKIIKRYFFDGTEVPNGGHNTGEFVDPIGEGTFLPPKPSN